MPQAYRNPAREPDPYALPDLEVFYLTPAEAAQWNPPADGRNDYTAGWYYWPCFPGCLPDSDPLGPFPSYRAALANARADNWQDEDETE